MPADVVYSTVACKEVAFSLREGTGESSAYASVTLRCAWADRNALVVDIVGNAKVYPRFPLSGARAQNATVVPAPGESDSASADAGEQGCKYDEALVSINYGQPKGDNGTGETAGGQLFSESLEPSAEFTTLDHTNFRWGSGSGDELVAQESPGKLQIGLDYVLTKYNLSSIPNLVMTSLGKVNSTDVVSQLLGLTFDAETLLLASASPTRQLDTEGNGKWTLPMRFSIRPTGWNKFWRAKTRTYEFIYVVDEGIYRSYELTNMSGLMP